MKDDDYGQVARVDFNEGASQVQYYWTDEELRSWKFKLGRTFARYFSQLSLCDRNSLHQVIQYRWRRSRGRKEQDGRELERRELEHIWPTVFLVIYFIITVQLIIWLKYQFQFDTNSYRLNRLQTKYNVSSACQQAGVGGSVGEDSDCRTICELDGWDGNLCSMEQEYKRRINESYRIMKSMGNPYINLGFTMEAALVLSLVVVYLTYLHPQIATYGIFFELFLVNILVEEEREFKRCVAMVKHEAQLMMNSSQNYAQSAIQNATRHQPRLVARIRSRKWGNGSAQKLSKAKFEQLVTRSPDVEVAWAYREHQLVTSQLKLLSAGSRMHPINRRSAEWRQEILDAFVKAGVGNLVYSFIIDWILLYFMHLFTGRPLDFSVRMDTIMMFELWIYWQISVISTTYLVPTFLSHCANQTKYLRHVISRVRNLIIENDRDFVEMLANCDSPASFAKYHERLNFRLTEGLLEYRVYLAQLASFLPCWSRFVAASFLGLFGCPVIGRVYGSYIQATDFRPTVTLFSINTCIFADVVLVPICYFYYQGQELYKALSSLLGHAVELDLRSRKRFNGRPIYMVNSVELVRRELEEPERMMAHFLTRIPGFKATFPRLLEVHFYHSVFNLAIYYEIDAWKKLLGERFDDPFLLRV